MKYIIDFIDDATADQIDAWMVENEVTRSQQMSALTNVYLVECEGTPVTSELVEAVVEDENISTQLLERIEILPASNGEISEFNHDSEWWKTASAYEVDFNADTSAFEKRGSKTTVYVIDSGVAIDHPEFEGTNVTQLFSFNDDHTDTNGHGTSIASVIAGKTLGITSSKVKSVKVFDNTKTTMTSDLVRALDTVLSDILANPESIAIVNMSWSIPKNEYIEQKIQALINTGAFVVAAAGNNGVEIENVTPASMAAVLTVGAYTPDFVPADFSNYTSSVKNTEGVVNYGELDVWAPGVDIGAALLDGTIGAVAGTSIAAGITAACLAYNSDSLYSGLGVVPNVFERLSMYTLNKPNMLMLSEKYEGSVNRIVSFITGPTPTWRNNTINVSRVVYDTVDIYGYLTQSAYVSKIELDDDLPEGLSLSNGWIVGRLTNAPAEPTIKHYNVTVTFHTGDVNYIKLALMLANAGATPENAPLEFAQYARGCVAGSQCLGTTCDSCPNCDPKAGNCPCSQQCE